LNHESGGLQVPTKSAGSGDFSAPLDLDVTKDLTVNFEFADMDVGVDDSLFSNDERVCAGDGTVKVPFDAKNS
jgi:hypothetical protein